MTCCTDSCETWHGRRARGSAWLCKISPQSVQGSGIFWYFGPQNIKNFHFLVKNRPAWANLWPISKNFRGFYAHRSPTKVFQIWRDLLHRIQSYCWETAHRLFMQNFSMHPVGKTMRWIEKWLTFFTVSTCSYQHAKFEEDSTTRAGCRCKNMVFARFFSVTLRGQHAVCLRGYTLNKYCVVVYGWILMQFIFFFQKRLSFQMYYRVLIFVARWSHNFREIAVNNCEKSKYWQKSLCT